MPALFTPHNGQVDISFDWNNIELARAQEIIGEAAHYLWRKGRGPMVIVDNEEAQKPWEDLSNQEKLTMVYKYSQEAIIAMARTAKIDTVTGEAREETEQYIDDEYILD